MAQLSTGYRIGLAWRELRRGAAGTRLRTYLVGQDGPELEQAQLDALEVLAGEPDGLRMSEFADAMHVDPSTATRAIDRLERLGLAERIHTDDDRRFVHARITADGMTTIRRVAKLRAIGIERLLESFDDREREEFAAYLERFVASIDRLVDELSHGSTPPVSTPPARPDRARRAR
jgi:DNA-binding MarR family transcriptional regulator